jgi:predicted Zn-dependent protease
MRSDMDVLSLLFRWRRDQREARQDARDAQRLRRESREELHTLVDRDVSVWQKLFDSERDEGKREELRDELVRRLRAQAVLLDSAIVGHPEFQTLPANAARMLGEGNTSSNIQARLTRLAEDVIREGQCERALTILCLAQEIDPQPDPWITLAKAHALSHAGQFDEAVVELDELIAQPEMRRRGLTEKSLLLMQLKCYSRKEMILRPPMS